MFFAALIWLAIGTSVGAFSALVMPQNSFGLRGDIAIGFAGALAGGLIWPTLNIFLGVGLFNAVIGGLVGASLVLPVLRMVRPDLVLYLRPAPKAPVDLP